MRFVQVEVDDIEHVSWYVFQDKVANAFESVCITVKIHYNLTKREAIALASDILLRERPEWFVSGRYKWTLDLDKLKATVAVCKDLEWLAGRISIEPEYKLENSEANGRSQTSLIVTIMPEDITKELHQDNFISRQNITLPSLPIFQRDHPNASMNGFIMMQFGKTKAHQSIVNSIKNTLKELNLNGLRADDKEYSDDLLTNIRTYMHGCSFGIAVFERLTADDFNPNISLEVGYMMALDKPVFC